MATPDRAPLAEAPGPGRAMVDPLEVAVGGDAAPRRHYALEDTGFDEVPKRFRRFYRKWLGAEDLLAPNEVLCPVCKVVIRSSRELRPGDRLYCMPCMSRLIVVRTAQGTLEGRVAY
jgi:hypothetical protein